MSTNTPTPISQYAPGSPSNPLSETTKLPVEAIQHASSDIDSLFDDDGVDVDSELGDFTATLETVWPRKRQEGSTPTSEPPRNPSSASGGGDHSDEDNTQPLSKKRKIHTPKPTVASPDGPPQNAPDEVWERDQYAGLEPEDLITLLVQRDRQLYDSDEKVIALREKLAAARKLTLAICDETTF